MLNVIVVTGTAPSLINSLMGRNINCLKIENRVLCAKFFFHVLYILLVGTFRITGEEMGKHVSLCVCICDCV